MGKEILTIAELRAKHGKMSQKELAKNYYLISSN